MSFFLIIIFILFIILFFFCRFICLIICFLCLLFLIFICLTFIQKCNSFIQIISQYKITKHSASLHLPYFHTNISNWSPFIHILCFHIFGIINLRMYPWSLIIWIWNLFCLPFTLVIWIINLRCLPFTIFLIIPIIWFCRIWIRNFFIINPIFWLTLLR